MQAAEICGVFAASDLQLVCRISWQPVVEVFVLARVGKDRASNPSEGAQSVEMGF